MVLLNKNNLNIAKFCAQDKEASGALRSLYCEKDGTTACNGHLVVHVTLPKIAPSLFPVMAEVPNMKHDDKPFLISSQSALEIAKNIPDDADIPALRCAALAVSEKRVRGATTDLEMESVVAENQVLSDYPKWRSLHPKESADVEIVINAALLRDLCASAAQFQKGMPLQAIRIRAWKDRSKPLYVEAMRNQEGQTWKAYVMQCRVSESSFGTEEQAK